MSSGKQHFVLVFSQSTRSNDYWEVLAEVAALEQQAVEVQESPIQKGVLLVVVVIIIIIITITIQIGPL